MGTKAFASLIYALEENPNLDLAAFKTMRKRKSKRQIPAQGSGSCDPEIVNITRSLEIGVKQKEIQVRVDEALDQLRKTPKKLRRKHLEIIAKNSA